MEKAEVKISRRGSVSIHIPGDNGTTSTPTASFNPISSSGGPTYRERARELIERTLSPGSEFSFGDTDFSSHSVSSGNSGHSSGNGLGSGAERLRERQTTSSGGGSYGNHVSGSGTFRASGLPGDSLSSAVKYPGNSAAHLSSVDNNNKVPRSSAEVRYVRGVGKSTVTALDRLEDALARTASLSGTWSSNKDDGSKQHADERAAAREIAYLRNMQEQMASASSRLLQQSSGSSRVVPATPAGSVIAAKLAAVSPGQAELDQTLNRLHQAATREGVLRMENLRLRKDLGNKGGKKGRTTTAKKQSGKQSGNSTSTRDFARVEQLLSGGVTIDRGANASVPVGIGGTAANLWLRCAVLEEKSHEAEQRARVAEASAEAIAHQLRKLRESNATSALTSEAQLYQRIEHGLMAVETVAAPLAALVSLSFWCCSLFFFFFADFFW